MKRLKRLVRDVRRGLQGPDADAERRLGDERRGAGDWAMAARHYQAHVSRHPRDFGIWVQLGHALKETGRFDDADAAYRTAHQLNPADADLMLCRGHLAKQRGDLDAAAELYSRSFELDGNPHAARELGQLSGKTQPVGTTPILTLSGAIDGFGDGWLGGWAVDSSAPDAFARIEVLLDGELLATGVADLDRPDLVAAGLAKRTAGFKIDLTGKLDLAEAPVLEVRLAGSQQPLVGSPMRVGVTDVARAWSERWTRAPRDGVQALVNRVRAEAPDLTLSILVPVKAGDRHLGDLIASLSAQWCDRWEALLVQDAERPLTLPKALAAKLAKDRRFRVLDASPRDGSRLRAAIGESAGDHVLILEPDSILEPEAVWRVLDAAKGGADIVYWDEARIGAAADGVERFVFRPALSLEHLEGFPGLVGSFSARRDLASSLLGAGRPEGGAAAPSLSAALARDRRVAHVPAILERRRRTVAGERDPVPARSVLAERAPQIDAHRTLIVVSPTTPGPLLKGVAEALLASTLRSTTDLLIVRREEPGDAKNRYLQRLSGIAVVSSHDGAASPNQAVNEAVFETLSDHDTIVLIDGAVTPPADWLEPLLALLARPGVGMVGPILVDPNGKVASAGVVVGGGGLRHSHHGTPLMAGRSRAPGWNRSLVTPRQQSAAAGLVAMRAETFRAAGGLDPVVGPATAIVDLCLRVGHAGLRTVIEPGVVCRIEGVSPDIGIDAGFRDRWAARIGGADPFHHPLLDADFMAESPGNGFAATRFVDTRPGAGSTASSVFPMLPDRSRTGP